MLRHLRALFCAAIFALAFLNGALAQQSVDYKMTLAESQSQENIDKIEAAFPSGSTVSHAASARRRLLAADENK